jgi:putative hemolysin
MDPDEDLDEVSEEEIRMMVDAGSEKGTIDNEEREFIQNVFEFDDLTARELATHRTDVIMLDMEDSMDVWKETIHGTRHTRYPICEGSVDKIVGVLNAKEYFRLENKDRDTVMEFAVLPPYFVPDTIKADSLFRNMKREKRAFAVVLDEYGGTTGIITVNDLIAQLVGDMADENEGEEEALIEYMGENTWHVHGSALLDDLSEQLGVPLYCEDYDTLNGLVFHTLESVPGDGEDIEVEVSGLHIKVTEIENHQVETAIVTVLEKEKTEEAEE